MPRPVDPGGAFACPTGRITSPRRLRRRPEKSFFRVARSAKNDYYRWSIRAGSLPQISASTSPHQDFARSHCHENDASGGLDCPTESGNEPWSCL